MSTLFAGLSDKRLRLVAAAAVVNNDVSAGACERPGGGAADAARSAGDQCSFVTKIGHGHPPSKRKVFVGRRSS
jgi:hypothetical protein